MQLIIDVGNTIQKYAVYHRDEQIAYYTTHAITVSDIETLTQQFPIKSYIYASVSQDDDELLNYLSIHFAGFVFSNDTPLPIKNLYATPSTLGKDRLACVVGAWALFPQQSSLVIDAGTCIKYDCILANGTYIGGAISPGLNMRLKAMHNYTARLPLIDIEVLKQQEIHITGNSTINSMLSGAGMGAAMEMEGMIQNYTYTYSELKVLITGGDASFFENHIKSEIFALPYLVLFGLHKILDFHFKNF